MPLFHLHINPIFLKVKPVNGDSSLKACNEAPVSLWLDGPSSTHPFKYTHGHTGTLTRKGVMFSYLLGVFLVSTSVYVGQTTQETAHSKQ